MNFNYPSYERVYVPLPYQGNEQGRRLQVVFAPLPGPSQRSSQRQINKLTQQLGKLTVAVNKVNHLPKVQKKKQKVQTAQVRQPNPARSKPKK